MTRHLSAIPLTYRVDPTEPYVCKYCGGRIPLREFHFHRCLTRRRAIA
jgi:hypothetical protein